MHAAGKSAWVGIAHQLCPRCRNGKIFSKSLILFPAMHERCPACGLKFEREQGYFLGAMYIGYGLGVAAIAGFSFAVWALFHCSIPRAALFGTLLFVPLAPWLTLLARVLWIYLDQTIDPDRS